MTRLLAFCSLGFGMMLVVAPAAVWAQAEPRLELSGGYSLLHSEPRFQKDLTGHGWNVAAAFSLARFFDVVGDVSQHHFAEHDDALTDIRASTFSYLAGPRIGWNTGRWTPFGHALIGGRRTASSLGASEAFPETKNQLAYGLGGGLDMRLTTMIGYVWRK